MSRVYQALEKAEREKEEKEKEETSAKVGEQIALPKKDELPAVREEGEGKRLELKAEEETPILTVPLDSFAAEQFRKLKTQIFHWNPKPPQVILVTSTTSQEGKTLVAFNLALAISQEFQKKAILIDADLRKPSIHLKKHRGQKGLSDYLTGKVQLSEILIHVEDNLWVIPAGPSTGKSSEFIATKGMRDFLKTLREFGEDAFIILDSPPLVSTSDPLVLSKMADGVIMVVMADRTPRESVRRAVKSIEREKIIGVVMNQKDVKPSRYYAKYFYRYHER